jgi:type IV secretory pathway VirB10-like protein
MGKKTVSPDLKNGTAMTTIIVSIFGGSLVVASLIGVYFIFQNRAVSEDEQNQAYINKVESNGLPTDFFIDSDFYDKDEEPIVENKPITNEKPKEKIVYKTIYIEKEPEIKAPLNANGMFQSKKITVDSDYLKKQALKQKIYMERLGGNGMAKVAITNDFYSNPNIMANSSDKNWNAYGITQDKASYPVKLERVITIDKMIPCILVNEIISDLQGKVTCKVEENVYGAHGRKILIPAHSTGIGFYQPLQKIGDERLAINWSRIITPDGININTTKAQVADQMGRSGITGEVDNRYTERYGLALLSSAVTSAASYSIPVENINQQIVVSNMTQDLGTVTNKILDEHINIKPRVTIPAATRIFINPVVDIWFPEPKNNMTEINAQEYN